MLLPVLSRAREQARATVCMNNLRQCGIALTMFEEEKGRFPESPSGGYTPDCFWGNWPPWDMRTLIKPYLADLSLWKCPSMSEAVNIDDPTVTRWQGSYGTYFYFPDRDNPDFGRTGQRTPISTREASTPSDWPLMQDKMMHYQTTELLYNHGSGSIWHWAPGNPAMAARHYGTPFGVNTSFFDGHIVWYKWRELENVGLICNGVASDQVLYSVKP